MSDKIGLVFAGQGTQHPGMGQSLYEQSAAARDYFDQAEPILGWDLKRLCFEGPQEELTACSRCQPAIFVVSMAAFAAWQEEHPGETPAITGGLSLGEISAVVAAGALSFTEGLAMVAERGRLMDECCLRYPGSMAAVIGAEPAAVAQAAERHGIDVANYNCPGQLIISGTAEGVSACSEELSAVAMKIVPLAVAGAYHSRLMREAGERFREYLEGVPFRAPSVPLVHNVTGELADPAPAELRRRLAEQIYSPVRFEECAGVMMNNCTELLELGPGKVLAGLIRRINRKFPVQSTDL